MSSSNNSSNPFGICLRPVTQHPRSSLEKKWQSDRSLLTTTTKDAAAKFLEKEHKHHAIVINDDGNFVGLLSSWDVVADTAEEARAWPWNRFM